MVPDHKPQGYYAFAGIVRLLMPIDPVFNSKGDKKTNALDSKIDDEKMGSPPGMG